MISNNLNSDSIFDKTPGMKFASSMQKAKVLGREIARLYQEALASPDEQNNTHQERDVVNPFFDSLRDTFGNDFDAKVNMMDFIQKIYNKAKPIFATVLNT